jgi:hypothetical protein
MDIQQWRLKIARKCSDVSPHYNISESKQMSFRGMGGSIASSIWQQLDKFGNEVKEAF